MRCSKDWPPSIWETNHNEGDNDGEDMGEDMGEVSARGKKIPAHAGNARALFERLAAEYLGN